MLSRVVDNISSCNLNNRDMLREIIVKIGVERIDMQERVVSRSLKVDSIFISLFHFIFIFLFIFDLFSIFN